MEVQRKYFIYILDIDNRGANKSFWNQSRIYYVGITESIGRRIGDYLFKRGAGYVNTKWRNSRIIPVYVGYFYGTKSQAETRERSIKAQTRKIKEELINGESNMLVGYKPLKHLILREDNTEIIVKIK